MPGVVPGAGEAAMGKAEKILHLLGGEGPDIEQVRNKNARVISDASSC